MADGSGSSELLTVDEMRAQIMRRLSGTLTDAQLAAWAFDRFYAYELETATLDEKHEETLLSVLDTLMFGDAAEFRLTEEELRQLLAQLDAA